MSTSQMCQFVGGVADGDTEVHGDDVNCVVVAHSDGRSDVYRRVSGHPNVFVRDEAKLTR